MTFSTLAIILLPFSLILFLLIFITVNRYIAYKERIELARLGYSLEEVHRALRTRRQGNRGVLWGGVITSASGLALLIGLGTLGIGAWLIGGLLPLFVGLGMVIIYFVTVGPANNQESSRVEEPVTADEEDAEADLAGDTAPWEQDAAHED